MTFNYHTQAMWVANIPSFSAAALKVTALLGSLVVTDGCWKMVSL